MLINKLCITFDVTNCLIKVAGSVGAQYARILKNKFDYDLDENLANLNFRKLFKPLNLKHPGFGFSEGMKSEEWWDIVVKEIIKSDLSSRANHQRPTLSETKLNDMSQFLFREFSKGVYWQKYPDCDYVLERLENKYNLGIISNFDERLLNIIDDLGIKKYFSFVVIPSACSGFYKPRKEVFLEAQKLGKSSDILHIGDDLDLDYNAARNAGFESILIVHNNQNKDLILPKTLLKNNKPSYVFNLKELIDRID